MGYFRRGALIERFTTTTTANGTTSLANNSTTIQVFTGTQNQSVVLPNATTCDNGTNSTGGQKFYLCNRSSGVITVYAFGGALRLAVINSNTEILVTLIDGSISTGTWQINGFTQKEQPLKLFASATPDSKINISSNSIYNLDGTDTQTPPISSIIPTVVASTHDLQTGTTTGATFSGAAAPTTTVGQYRRVGYTLLASGSIQVIWSASAGSIGALPNAGTVFVKTGLPIGWIDIEATAATSFKTIGSATNIIENIVSGTPRVHRFGSGGGGGGGTGNANSFQLEMEARLSDSPFNMLTTNVIEVDGVTKVDGTSTGSQDVANNVYTLGSGIQLITTQNYDPTFLASFQDNVATELHVLWGTLDTAGVYSVSRDGGLNYATATMTRQGASNKYRGIVTFAEPVTTSTLVEYNVSNADTPQNLDTTSNQQAALSFTVAGGAKWRTSILRTYITKTGSPTGYAYCQIVKDSAGSPSTAPSDIVAESAGVNIANLSAGNQVVDFTVTQPLPAGTYWMLLRTDATYKASYAGGTNIAWRADNSSPTYPGVTKTWNGTTWTSTTLDLCFQIIGVTYDLRIKVVGGTAGGTISAVGILYEEDSLGISADAEERQAFNVDGSTDQTSFVVTNFNVNPRYMKVYDSDADAVYTYPKYSVNGNTVTFPAGTFLAPGKKFKVVFEQLATRSSFTTDRLAAVLATNGLGSFDANFDFSAAGIGPKIRRPDGTLREITLDNSDNIVIKSVP